MSLRSGLALLALLALAGCATSPFEQLRRVHELESETGVRVFFLEFDSTGRIINPAELTLTREELVRARCEGEPYERIVVLSYGWNTELSEATTTYVDVLDRYYSWLSDQPSKVEPARTAIVCIKWDSRFSVVRDAIDAVLPMPYIAEFIGWPFDTILFPVSFWSRASAADAIGGRALSRSLEILLGPTTCCDPEEHLVGHSLGVRLSVTCHRPLESELHFVGHSFGGRLILECLRNVIQSKNPPLWLSLVRGALLIQPAVHDALVPRDSIPFPLVITHNTFDKANKLLYPLANLGLNTSLVEVVSRNETSIDAIEEHASSGGIDAVEAMLAFYSPGAFRALGGSSSDASLLAKVWAFPLIVEWPVAAYRWRPTFAATFSELPILGWPIQKVGASVSGDPRWGRKGPGFLTGGLLFHSAGASPLMYGRGEQEFLSYDQALDDPLDPGTYRVDLSTVSTRSFIFGYDMDCWLGATFLSWWDPIGTHSDYENPHVQALIHKSLTGENLSHSERDRDADGSTDPAP